MHTSLNRRSAFTLVEMLVVIGIIGILAALLIPVVQGALQNAQKTSNATELSQILIAVQRYTSENGGQFPPSFGEAQAQGTTYRDLYTGGTYKNTILFRYLTTAYPRISDVDIRYMFEFVADQQDQSTALYFWLAQTSNDPRHPFTNQAGFRKYYEFDASRSTILKNIPAAQLSATFTSTNLDLYGYRPRYAKESYFAYLEAKHYRFYVNQTVNLDQDQGQANPASAGGALLRPYLQKKVANANRNDPANYMNPDKFQLLCAGLDGVYQHDLKLMRLYPSGPQGLTYNNGTIPLEQFQADRDNQADFSEGRTIEDVLPQ